MSGSVGFRSSLTSVGATRMRPRSRCVTFRSRRVALSPCRRVCLRRVGAEGLEGGLGVGGVEAGGEHADLAGGDAQAVELGDLDAVEVEPEALATGFDAELVGAGAAMYGLAGGPADERQVEAADVHGEP